MPLYEYECDTNRHRFEVIRKFSDPPLDKCPTCGSPVHKLVSSPAFQFKGTGWYVTDYAKKDASGNTSSGGAKEETKSDEAKPAAASGEGSSNSSSGDSTSSTTDSAGKPSASKPSSSKPAASTTKTE